LIKPLVVDHYLAKIYIGEKSRYAKTSPEGCKAFEDSFRELTDIGYMVSKCIITNVQSKGKFMYWTFDNGWYMLCTFGMTGQWSPDAGKHVCLKMRLYDAAGNQSYIHFNDPRHFGTIKFTNSRQELVDKLNELGWDPLQNKLSDYSNFLINKLSNSKKPIGQIMMEQNVFAGVGNYIRAEALYLAKISPWRLGNQLSKTEITNLCQSCIDVMEESYKYQGATIQTYKTAFGAEGKYSSCFKVYGKKKDPLGNKIIKEDTPEGRTIHWCPTIQT
jgi:formamidopyrimidine-DNA glycosylase